MTTKAEFEEMAATRIEKAVKRAKFISDHWERLAGAGVEPSQLDPFYPLSIDINQPTREQTLAVIKAIPGDWEKEASGLEGKIDYLLKKDEFTIRLWASPPPPSCRLIEEEVEIPAQPARKEKRTRLECAPEVVEIVVGIADQVDRNINSISEINQRQ